MKKLFIIIALLTVSPAFAVGIAGQRRDGTVDPSFVTRSVKSTTVILDCGGGRMRSVRNYKTKCVQKQTGILRSSRTRKSNILQKSAPRYRITMKPTVRRTQRTSRKSVESIKAAYWAKWRKLKATLK